ncbi:11771_t:CDS:2, partial [Gigaspora margarita]
IYFNEPEDSFHNILAIRSHYNKPVLAFASASILSNQPILSNQFEKLTLIRKVSESKKPNKKFLQDRIWYILTLTMKTEMNKEVNNWCHQFIQQKRNILKALFIAFESNINEILNQKNDQENDQENDSENDLENVQENNQDNQENNQENDQENTVQVTNPQKSALELESKRPLQTINENSNHEESSKHEYTCSNCYMQGYNIRSYKLL